MAIIYSSLTMVDPKTSFLSFAEHDHRIYFVFNTNQQQFVYLNPAFESFFKVSRDTASPDELLSKVHPDDKVYLLDCVSSLKPGVLKDDIEFRIETDNRDQCFVRLRLLLDQDEEEEANVIGYLEDITKHVEHNNKLNEYSNKKNAILNILSHDLVGPLGSIKNLAELLTRSTKTFNNERVNRLIASIDKTSRKGIYLLQEFIKQEFLESAGVEMVKKRINLVQSIQSLLSEYQQSPTELSKVISFECSSAEIYVEIDEAKFIQAINNLLSNSIKFTDVGGAIKVKLEDKESTVIIIVSDNGIGIPQQYQANLFDKFNNARRTGLKGEPSVGLGMSIIKTM